jgi:NADH dehydrogenase
MEKKKKVVILGGGFAGMFAYLTLLKKGISKDLDITIVNKTDEFVFIPLIHEVATGSLTPSSVTQPIRSVATECRFLEGEVTRINLDAKKVHVKNLQAHRNSEDISEPEVDIYYDYLVISLGAQTNFWDTPGAKENSYTLYTMEDAKNIKNQIIESFEKAQFLKDKNDIEKTLTFVVVGGGPTGTELAAEIADFINTSIRKTFSALSKASKVLIIHSGERILEPAEEWFGLRGQKVLDEYGVEILLNTRVGEVGQDSIVAGDRTISTESVFWTAGVLAVDTPVEASKEILKDPKTNRFKVNQYLQIPNYPEVFVAGDQAHIIDKDSLQPYPMRAQFATREGRTAADNIENLLLGKPLMKFDYNDLGFIVSFGRGNALAKLFGVRLEGPLAWLAYRGAYWLKVVGIKAKIRTLVEWVLNLFFSRDVSKL